MLQAIVLVITVPLLVVMWRLAAPGRPTPPLSAPEPLTPVQRSTRLRLQALRTPIRRRARLRQPHAARLLRRMAAQRDDLPCLALLRDQAQALLLPLVSLRRGLRHAPALPADGAGRIRMLQLAQTQLQSGGRPDAAGMAEALAAWQEGSATTLRERQQLPLCFRHALAQRLQAALRALRQEVREHRRGAWLAGRMQHSRRPMALLSCRVLPPACLSALAERLRRRDQATLLAALEEHLTAGEDSLARVEARHSAHQVQLAEEFTRCLEGFTALAATDWPGVSEAEDPLHRLLEADPAGVYPRMDAATRRSYRHHAAWLARLTHAEEAAVVRAALACAGDAEPDGLPGHVGWYLMEAAGRRALLGQLHTRRGRVRLALHQHRLTVQRIALAAAHTALAIVWLEHRQPMLLLPAFLCVSAAATHAVAARLTERLLPAPPLCRMEVPRVEDAARTLIVLPAVIRTPDEAAGLVRQLRLARSALPGGAVDCLLLADHADCLTQTSSGDAAVTDALRTAVAAADGEGGRYLYLHRRRVWEPSLHVFAGRSGRGGALDGLHRLITEGGAPDEYEAATVPPGSLCGRYAFTLILGRSARPAPEVLAPMIGALLHPLNERRATPQGMRGLSLLRARPQADPAALRSRLARSLSRDEIGGTVTLCRPEALLEATDGLIPPGTLLGRSLLDAALSGCAQDEDAAAYAPRPGSVRAWMESLHRETQGHWELLPWQLSHVQTPRSVRRNPWRSEDRWRLRQRLRESLLPACRLALTAQGALTASPVTVLTALLLPPLAAFMGSGVQGLRQAAGRTELLPLEAAVRLDAIASALLPGLRRPSPAVLSHGAQVDLTPLENWSQGLCAAAVAALAVVSPLCPAGLAAAGLFALFPFVHAYLDAPADAAQRPTPEAARTLGEIARATWRFFDETVTAATHHLPPETLQPEPDRGASPTVATADIGLYLLACLGAAEAGLIDADALCRRVSDTLSTLRRLPLWHGLPYRRYDLASLKPAPPAVISTADCGVLCACLIAVAQGLRSYPADLPLPLRDLPRQADDFARGMSLRRLYDPQAQLFRAERDPLRPDDAPHLSLPTGGGLLAGYVAVMRREVPPTHLARLNRTMVRTGGGCAQVSRTGGAAEYLLPALLLPPSPGTAAWRSLRAVVASQRRHSAQGMFGFTESCFWGFDGDMRYLSAAHGVASLALESVAPGRVISPCGAALCLPLSLPEALESLQRLRSRGMFTHLGYYDALDLTPSHLPADATEARVTCYASGRQAMLLCAVCSVLTSGYPGRHFAAAAQTAAYAPLLLRSPAGGVLPGRALHPAQDAPQEESFRLRADSTVAPLQAQLVGHPGALMLTDAQGGAAMWSRGVALTRFTGDPTQPAGLQFYVCEDGRVHRLSDPSLPGDAVFTEGCARFTRQCGSLACALTALAEPLRDRFIHVVDVTNPTGRERIIDVADCLLPALTADPDAIEDGLPLRVARPRPRTLTVTRHLPDGTRRELCHLIATHEPLMAVAAACDRTAAPEASAPRNPPPWLTAPLAEGDLAAPAECAAFRARLRLPPRGRAAVMFVTRLVRPGESDAQECLAPRIGDVSSLMTHARLLSRSITRSLGVTQARLERLTLLTGALMWRHQPHQGALTPLSLSGASEELPGLSGNAPLLLIAHTGEDTALLSDCAACVALMCRQGREAVLCVLCEGDRAASAAAAVKAALAATPLPDAPVLLNRDLASGRRALLEARAQLILYEGAGDASAQLRSLSQPLLNAAAPALPASSLPDPPPLCLPQATGGFDAQTWSYVLRPGPADAASLSRATLHRGDGLACAGQLGRLGAIHAGMEALPVTHPVQGETVWLADDDGAAFTATPLPMGSAACEVRLDPGMIRWHSRQGDLDVTLTAAPMPRGSFALRTLRVRNTGAQARRLRLSVALRFVMGRSGAEEALVCLTAFPGGVAALSPHHRLQGCAALVEGVAPARCMSPLTYAGTGDLPAGIASPLDEGSGTVAVLDQPLTVPALGSADATWVVGACRQTDELERLLRRLRQEGVSGGYRAVTARWEQQLTRVELSTPDPALDLAMNRLLPAQLLNALPAEGAWAPAEGVIRLCDVLEAAAALVHIAPDRLRDRLLDCARHQFPEGDVQSDWRPPCTGRRTRRTGDRLLLPLAAAWYVRTTGDAAVLDATAPWLDAPLLGEAQEQALQAPAITAREDTLLEHCLRALTSLRLGAHGLPLMHGGDRGDGLDGVRGESVWLALMYMMTLQLFAEHAPDDLRAEIGEVCARLREAVEQAGWDGGWYRRAFFPDGRALGSAASADYRIDAATQGLAMQALGVTERSAQAVDAAWRELYDEDAGQLHAFAPPLGGMSAAGTAALYPAGHPLNGGQDARSAAWLLLGLTRAGDADRAWTLLRALLPLNRPAGSPQQSDGAGMIYTSVLSGIVGLEKRGDRVRLRPCVPAGWDEYTVILRPGRSEWRLTARRSVRRVTADGSVAAEGWVTMVDDGGRHEAEFPLG